MSILYFKSNLLAPVKLTTSVSCLCEITCSPLEQFEVFVVLFFFVINAAFLLSIIPTGFLHLFLTRIKSFLFSRFSKDFLVCKLLAYKTRIIKLHETSRFSQHVIFAFSLLGVWAGYLHYTINVEIICKDPFLNVIAPVVVCFFLVAFWYVYDVELGKNAAGLWKYRLVSTLLAFFVMVIAGYYIYLVSLFLWVNERGFTNVILFSEFFQFKLCTTTVDWQILVTWCVYNSPEGQLCLQELKSMDALYTLWGEKLLNGLEPLVVKNDWASVNLELSKRVDLNLFLKDTLLKQDLWAFVCKGFSQNWLFLKFNVFQFCFGLLFWSLFFYGAYHGVNCCYFYILPWVRRAREDRFILHRIFLAFLAVVLVGCIYYDNFFSFIFHSLILNPLKYLYSILSFYVTFLKGSRYLMSFVFYLVDLLMLRQFWFYAINCLKASAPVSMLHLIDGVNELTLAIAGLPLLLWLVVALFSVVFILVVLLSVVKLLIILFNYIKKQLK